MFGDILMWAITAFGLIPMLNGLFGPKKTFQEQLAEFSDDFQLDDADRLDADGLGDWEDPVVIGDPDPTDIDDEARHWFQEIGECEDEHPQRRRFSMLEDF